MPDISACRDGARQSSAGSVAHYIRLRHAALLNTSLVFAHQADLQGTLMLRSPHIISAQHTHTRMHGV